MSNQRFDELCSIAGPVSRETYEMLLRFENTFLKWNQRINLSAPSTLGQTWQRHILDSAQLLAIEPQATQWLDIGSGGGFPGIVIAFLLRERGGSIDLVESNRKKTGFLQAMVGEFDLPARIHARRIEDIHKLVRQPQVVTARALASLSLLLDLAAPWLTNGARGLFHKGRDYRAEVEESAHHWNFDLVEHASTIDPQGVVLDIRNLRKM